MKRISVCCVRGRGLQKAIWNGLKGTGLCVDVELVGLIRFPAEKMRDRCERVDAGGLMAIRGDVTHEGVRGSCRDEHEKEERDWATEQAYWCSPTETRGAVVI